MQFGKEMLQLFQIAAVFERFLLALHRRFGVCWQAPETFRRPEKLAKYVGEVLGLDGGAVFSLRAETSQGGTQVVIHPPQGFERVRWHYPFHSTCARSDSGIETPEGTVSAAAISAPFSARSTSIQASRTANTSVIS